MSTSARSILPIEKYENEAIGQSVDFVDRLEQGETISSQGVTSQLVADGSDTSSTIIDTVGLSGTAVTFLVQAGTAGDAHWIDVAVTLNTAEVHVQRMRLDILEP